MTQHRIRLWLLLTGCVLSLAACESDVTLQNPQTGETATCHESLAGFDPWSQKDTCVVGYITQGWTTTNRQ